MTMEFPPIDRRRFLMTSAAATLSAAVPSRWPQAAGPAPFALTAAPHEVKLIGPDEPATAVWAYNGAVPGPVLRARRGDTMRIAFSNGLDEATTIHWHGLRIPNAMDGVPYLTQDPIGPGNSFAYEFPLQDAGTFWYHPHVNTPIQVGRGLAGALIVDETDPPAVDRDVVWALDDWRLQKDATFVPFGALHDAAHGGRFGNVATINGTDLDPFEVTAGERLRLRLINAANARIFGLLIKEHDPWLIAVDGHPVKPRKLKDGRAIVAPGMRLDLIVDMTGNPGDSFDVIDGAYQRQTYRIARIGYRDASPLRRDRPPPVALEPNPVAVPDMKSSADHEMVFQGGAMGGLREAAFKGEAKSLRDLAAMGMVWAVNGEVLPPMEAGDVGDPMLDLKLGRSYRLRWTNDTAFDHPIHMHGHSFHVLARNGVPLDEPQIQDTVLIAPEETVDVAFVADNPGDWALHCHVLEHAAAGMMGYVRVS